ncbi:hypothetical protein Tco_0164564 [Tanacetum coccineum]
MDTRTGKIKKEGVPVRVGCHDDLVLVIGLRVIKTKKDPNKYAYRMLTHLQVLILRPIHKKIAFKYSNFNQRVNTIKDKNVNAARPKAVVNTARPKVVVNAVKGNNVNAVKASACWVSELKTKVLDHVSKHNSASTTLKKFDYVDAQGKAKKSVRLYGIKTDRAKTVNEEVQLQALVDGKKIIITKSTVRRDLQLKDDDGVYCLPTTTIFEQLTLISSKTIAWNEFSSTMASTIICLATNQKFNFSKYIFESMVKNLDNTGKNLMYLRRVGKSFSGRETPLFQTMVVQEQAEIGEGSANPTDPHHTPTIIQPSTSQPQKKQRPRKPKRKDTQIPQSSFPSDNVVDEAVNEDMDYSLVRAATTTTSLDAKQDRGSGPRCQETMGDTISQTRFESVSKTSNDPLLVRVLDLEITKTTQANDIASLKRRVKKLETRNKSRTYGLKRLYKVGSSRRVESSEDEGLGEEDASKQGRIADIDANKDIYLVNVQADEDMFGVNNLDDDEVIIESVDIVNTAEETRSVVEEVTVVTILVSAAITTTTTTAITNVEITLAQALTELKSEKPKAVKVVIQEPEQGTTTTTLTTTTAATTIIVDSTRPKAKWIVFHEHEQAPTPTVSSQQPSQVKVQDKGKGKMVESKRQNLVATRISAKIEVDYQLAQRLQAQEQEELTNEEKARLFVQFLEQRRKQFEAKRVEEKRNKSPTRAQQRIIMSMKMVNTFVDYRTELVEESSKKAETELVEEKDKESEELKQCLEIVPDDGDDVTIDATPLSTKSSTIVDYKIYKENKKSYFQIIRADVKARFKKIEPVNYMVNFLLLNLKTMFEHHVEDNVWKNKQGIVKVLNWKLYDFCGVHYVTMQSMLFYLLVEKMYPLTNHTLHQMFNEVKLQVDYECEMAFELLRLDKKQLKEGYKNIKFREGLLGLKASLKLLLLRSSSLAVTSSRLSSDVSDAGLPSKKVMASRKNGDDGDLLLFQDGPAPVQVIGLPERLASRCPVAASCSGELSGTLLESD